MALWSNKQQLEQMKRLQEMAHEVHKHLTDMITGDDLQMAEMYIGHALRVLKGREEDSNAG